VEKQEATITEMMSAIAKQQATNSQQQKQIEALTAGLQKVNERFEKTTPAPPLLANSRWTALRGRALPDAYKSK
jgi:uncharacterized coiled-coil protein SlyX